MAHSEYIPSRLAEHIEAESPSTPSSALPSPFPTPNPFEEPPSPSESSASPPLAGATAGPSIPGYPNPQGFPPGSPPGPDPPLSRSSSISRACSGSAGQTTTSISRSGSLGRRTSERGQFRFALHDTLPEDAALREQQQHQPTRPDSAWGSPLHSPPAGGGQQAGNWPYSTAASSTSSLVSESAHKNKEQSFGMSAGNTIEKPDYSEAKIVVAMVGLPARGKSYLSNKLQRYLLWLEYEVKVFNVGQLRRSKYKKQAETTGKKGDQSANFFDANNKQASREREHMASECLEQLISWLKAGGNVGIHDATNTTRARRQALVDRVKREPGLKLLFIESVCTDPAVIAANVKVKVASGDPDYDGQEPEQAERDFLARIAHYEAQYEPLDEQLDGEYTWCKMVNVGKQVTVNRIDGYLQSRIAFYLMNLHLTPRSIFFTRHGESQYNVDGQIGGDAPLSTQGEKYMRALPQLIQEKIGDTPLTVWTSTLRRTIQTASLLPYEKLTWKSLDELDAGVCDGMTYEEIEVSYPEDYAARDDDKFNYRYRGGESYRDVVIRLEPVILELERQENILVVCHQAVLRCLYAYFHNLTQDELPYLKIPLHTVIKLTPKAYGCDEERFALPIEAVDTTRARPTSKPEALKREDRDLGVSPSTSRPATAMGGPKVFGAG